MFCFIQNSFPGVRKELFSYLLYYFKSEAELKRYSLFEKHLDLTMVKVWKMKDVRPDRNDEFWINIICKKL